MINSSYITRGLLFVPSYDKYLHNIEKLCVDAIIIDLEDSVSKDDKEVALEQCKYFLQTNKKDIQIYVRLNYDRAEYEISQLQDLNVNGFVFPKIEKADDIPNICKKPIIGLVETPKGVVNVEQYIGDDRITAIAFGAEDYSSLIECANEEEALIYPKSRLVTYAKAFDKLIYDTVYTDVHNDDGFRKAATKSKKLGFDGKLLIHPSQVAILEEIYDDLDYEFMEQIIQQFESNSGGVLYINNQIYERPHIEYFKKKLAIKRKDCLDE